MFLALQPKSILDIGFDSGKYGLLAHEYLDTPKKEVVIDAITGSKEDINPIHKQIYDSIQFGDANKLIDKLDKSYDLVMIIDTLGEFDRHDGEQLLRKLTSKHKSLVISVPRYISKQRGKSKASTQNKSHWRRRDFKCFGSCYFFNDPINNLVLISSPSQIDKLQKYYFDHNLKYGLGDFKLLNWLYRQLWWKHKHSI